MAAAGRVHPGNANSAGVVGPAGDYLGVAGEGARKRMKTMKFKVPALLNLALGAADVFFAAVRASACAERHVMPAAHDLAILGIDPAAFRRIGRG